jgi:hypothetical protein
MTIGTGERLRTWHHHAVAVPGHRGGVGCVAQRLHVEAGLVEHLGGEVSDVRFVVDQEQRLHGRRASVGGSTGPARSRRRPVRLAWAPRR